MKKSNDADVWRERDDPASGRMYWYNMTTRETTWKKPPEVQRVSSKMQRRTADITRANASAVANSLRGSNGGTSAAAAVAEPGSIGCSPHNAATSTYIEKVIALQPTLRRPN